MGRTVVHMKDEHRGNSSRVLYDDAHVPEMRTPTDLSVRAQAQNSPIVGTEPVRGHPGTVIANADGNERTLVQRRTTDGDTDSSCPP